MHGVKDELQKVIDDTRSDLSATRESLSSETRTREERDHEVIELNAALQRIKEQSEAEVRHLEESGRTEMERLRRSHNNETAFASEQHREAVASLGASHLEEKTFLNGEIDALKSEIETMQERWLARESRPEDIERIQELEREMIDKDALVKKTREEMAYFKRELLNREENFNKKFNTNPNVGVMSVIKPKAGKGDKDKKAQRRRSTQGQLPPPPGAGGLPPNMKENRRASGPVFGL